MTVDQAAELGRAALMMTILLGAPVLLSAIVVGLVISILQAVTQIQDQTISFVPKIVAMLVTLLIVLPWAMTRMIEYSTNLIQDIPTGL
jgi:flagellar biosynthetic protein FliQ